MTGNGHILRLPPLSPAAPAGRVPRWSFDELRHRACPVCSADKAIPHCRRPDDLVVARCGACGMLYVPDVPSEADLATLYGNYSEYKEYAPPRRAGLRARLSLSSVHPYIDILLRTGGLRDQRVCEIGCSFGGLLPAMRDHGAHVFGVEVDESALRHLAASNIPSARTLDKAHAFDVVCAFQLIEHLPDPAAWISEVSATLVPDGRLLLAFPNGGEAERIGAPWVGYRVDLEHLNYFTIATIADLLRRHDLYIEMFWEFLQPEVPRVPDRSVTPTGRLERLRGLKGLLTARPTYIDGTFTLGVLARKAS